MLKLQLSKVLHEMSSCSTYATREARAQSVVVSAEGRANSSLLAPKHPQRASTGPQHLYENFAISKDPFNAVAQFINLRHSAADMCFQQPSDCAEDSMGPKAGLRRICARCLATLAGGALLGSSAQVLPIVQSCTVLDMLEGFPLV